MPCLRLAYKLLALSMSAALSNACAGPAQGLPTLFPPEVPTQPPTQTMFVLATPTPEATPEQVDVIPTPVSMATATPMPPYVTEAHADASPNGQWLALTTVLLPASVPADQYYRQLRVMKLDHVQTWTVVDEWPSYGLGYPVPLVVHWSRDGHAMFFADQAVPDGCGALYTWNYRRLDLATGRVEPVIEAGSSAYAFSAASSVLAVASAEAAGWALLVSDPMMVAVPQTLALDLADGFAVEHIVWSDDEQALLLTAVPRDSRCGSEAIPPRTYIRVDLAQATQTPLLTDDTRGLVVQEWSGAYRVILRDPTGKLWSMNAQTGEVSPLP